MSKLVANELDRALLAGFSKWQGSKGPIVSADPSISQTSGSTSYEQPFRLRINRETW